MKKTISILGCGWLGKPTALELLHKEFIVKGSTTSVDKISKLKNYNIEPYIISLENLNNIIEDFLNSEILLIALPSKNVEGFKTLISFIEKSSIKRVLFISSTSVYTSKNEIVTEQSELLQSPLLNIENLFLNNTHFKTTIIRFAGLFGYNRKPGNFFSDGKIISNSNGFVNMIHQDDCVSIISKIIENEIWGEIFNACTDSHPTRKDFYTKVKKDIGVDPPKFEDSTFSPFKIVSNTKIKQRLNYTFKYSNLLEIDYNSPYI